MGIFFFEKIEKKKFFGSRHDESQVFGQRVISSIVISSAGISYTVIWWVRGVKFE
jgi:hypothetical protein